MTAECVKRDETEQQARERLIEELKQEVARLLCDDTVSEEEKIRRMKVAQAILESDEL